MKFFGRGFLLLQILLLPIMMASCIFTNFYVADPIEGWVVDEEAGQPLAGVNVVWLTDELRDKTMDRDNECEWKKIPEMINALYQQEKAFTTTQEINKFGSLYRHLISSEEYYLKAGCGSAHAFLKEHLK